MPTTPKATSVNSKIKLMAFNALKVRLLFAMSIKSFAKSNTKRGINAEKYKNKFFKNFISKLLPLRKILNARAKTKVQALQNYIKPFVCKAFVCKIFARKVLVGKALDFKVIVHKMFVCKASDFKVIAHKMFVCKADHKVLVCKVFACKVLVNFCCCQILLNIFIFSKLFSNYRKYICFNQYLFQNVVPCILANFCHVLLSDIGNKIKILMLTKRGKLSKMFKELARWSRGEIHEESPSIAEQSAG